MKFPVFLLCLLPFLFSCKKDETKPNIVVILADDLGLGDISYYLDSINPGQDYLKTPHIDWLIENGMRFGNATAPAPLCAPSRMGILGGIFPWRTEYPNGVWDPTLPVIEENRTGNFAQNAKTAGYATAFIGKWGMGGQFLKTDGESLYKNFDLTTRTEGPNHLGFDYAFELPTGIQGFLFAAYENDQWYKLNENSRFIKLSYSQTKSKPKNSKPSIGDSFWDPSRIGSLLLEKAMGFIDSHLKNDPNRPFLLFFSSQAIHVPHVPDEKLRVIDSFLNQKLAMISEFDQQVGRLTSKLRDENLLDNTLIIVTSDNGGTDTWGGMNPRSNLHLRGFKGEVYEGGTRVPLVIYWKDHIAKKSSSNRLVSLVDIHATINDALGIKNHSESDSKSLFNFIPSGNESAGHEKLVVFGNKGSHYYKTQNHKLIFEFNDKNPVPIAFFDMTDNPIEDPEKNLLDDPQFQDLINQHLNDLREYILAKNPKNKLLKNP